MAQAMLTRNAVRGRGPGAQRPDTKRTQALSAVPALIKAAPPLLELHLHLTNGTTRTFVQNDPDLARQLLRQVGPRVFTQRALILHAPDQVTAFAGFRAGGPQHPDGPGARGAAPTRLLCLASRSRRMSTGPSVTPKPTSSRGSRS